MNAHTLNQNQNQKNNTMKFNLLYKTRLQRKKNHCIIALFLCSIGLSLNAQTGYQSFFGDSSTTYHVFTSMTCYTHDQGILGCGDTYKHSITYQDTAIFNDTVYYRVLEYRNSCHSMYIREDTNTGRLYRYFPNLNKEFLTCDMSLNVGDTFQLPVYSDYFRFPEYFYWEEGAKLVVDSIVYINNKKIIYFPYIRNTVYGSAYYDGSFEKFGIRPLFIEGIGPTYSPFGQALPYSDEDLNVMLCVDKNDTLAFMLNEQLGCFQFAVNIKEIENAKIHIFPNPTNDYINLSIDNLPDISGEILILDIIGHVVYRKTIDDNTTKVNVAPFAQGVYTLVFSSKKGKLVSKFTKIY